MILVHIKDPDCNLSVVQDTSHSEEPSDEEDSALYAILSPSPWKLVVYDSSGCVVREDELIVTYGGKLPVVTYTKSSMTIH